MGVVRFSVTVPAELMQEFDETIRKMGYKSRSKAVQDALRSFLSEHRWVESKGTCIGAVLVLFNHEVKGTEDRLTDLQHNHMGFVHSTLHIHLSYRECLEIIVVKGDSGDVKKFSDIIKTVRGVEMVKFIGIVLSNC